MKRFILLFFMGAFVYSMNAQDVIYTLSTTRNGRMLSIDSVLVENLNNQTEILFGNLPPDLPEYNINLTQKAFWGATGIKKQAANKGFFVGRNIPGSLVIVCNEPQAVQADISVFNAAGQKIYTLANSTLAKGQAIQVRVGKPGIYVVALKTGSGTQAFKIIGSPEPGSRRVQVSVSGQQPLPAQRFKSEDAARDDGFSFTAGDTLRFTIYNKRYYAAPLTVEVNGSDSLVFPLKGEKGTFTDTRDGRVYKTIQIGKQTWMAENLAWDTGDSSSWAYDNDPKNIPAHGRLYTWKAAKSACPSGWHLPKKAEWDTLLVFMGMTPAQVQNIGYVKTDVAKKLKSVRDWFKKENGTDAVGFRAYPGGEYIATKNEFLFLTRGAYWWTATEYKDAPQYAWFRAIFDYNIYLSGTLKGEGYSVRCIEDVTK